MHIIPDADTRTIPATSSSFLTTSWAAWKQFQVKGTFNHLKYCVESDTTTLRVINASQIVINAECVYNIRNSSLST